jgi:hypothetical protein
VPDSRGHVGCYFGHRRGVRCDLEAELTRNFDAVFDALMVERLAAAART